MAQYSKQYCVQNLDCAKKFSKRQKSGYNTRARAETRGQVASLSLKFDATSKSIQNHSVQVLRMSSTVA